jgi:hypothetical protein
MRNTNIHPEMQTQHSFVFYFNEAASKKIQLYRQHLNRIESTTNTAASIIHKTFEELYSHPIDSIIHSVRFVLCWIDLYCFRRECIIITSISTRYSLLLLEVWSRHTGQFGFKRRNFQVRNYIMKAMICCVHGYSSITTLIIPATIVIYVHSLTTTVAFLQTHFRLGGYQLLVLKYILFNFLKICIQDNKTLSTDDLKTLM